MMRAWWLATVMAAMIGGSLLSGIAQAQPPPPVVDGYRFFAFLDYTAPVEEPLPTVIRREIPGLPQAWFEIEKYVTSYYPNAFTSPRSRMLKQGASIRLPMYKRPSELLVQSAAPPAPPPRVEIAPPPRPNEPIIGALVDADGPVAVESSLGQTRSLNAVDSVRRGDTLHTDDRTQASVRLLDGTVVLLRSDSSVRFQEFRFNNRDANVGALNLKLLRGAVRTISGMIPKNPQSQYALETPGATLRVHGTDYAVRWCEGECRLHGAPAENGLYAGVLEGGIGLANRSGSSDAAAGDIVRVANADTEAVPVPEAASLVFTPPELAQLPSKPICALPPNRSPTMANCGPAPVR